MVRPVANKVFEVEFEVEMFDQVFTLPFVVRCPKCHTEKIWRKTSADPRHSARPPRYQCAIEDCGKQFYPQTSALFKETRKLLIYELFEDLIVRGKRLETMYDQYGVRPSRLSELKTWLYGTIEEHVPALWQTYEAKVLSEEEESNDVLIYLDVMYVRVQNSLFALMLAVDRKLNVLAFRFGFREDAKTAFTVFQEALLRKGERIQTFHLGNDCTPRLIVLTDGNPCYRKMLIDHEINCIHVVHVHSDDSYRLLIRLLRYQGVNVVETRMGTAINVVRSSGTSRIRLLELIKKRKGVKRKRGRPKGSKNKTKPRPQSSKDPPRPKKRGPKNAWRDGEDVFFTVNVDDRCCDFWQPFPYMATLEKVAQHFYGSCITTNPVEIVNSQIRRLFRFTGPWTLRRAELALLTWIFFKSGIINPKWLNETSIDLASPRPLCQSNLPPLTTIPIAGEV